jgi:hypothetical protein
MIHVLLALAVGGAPESPPSVAEIEKAALDARLSIRTAYFRLKVNRVFPPNADMIGIRTIWIDGNKIRGEIIREKGPNVGSRFVSCLNCEKEGYGFDWVDLPGSAASMHLISAPNKPLGLRDAIDPRHLGYTFTMIDMLRHGETRLDAIIGATNRHEPTIRSEKLDGVDCWVLRWKLKNWDSDITVWIAPSKGNNVVRLKAVDAPNTVIVVDSDVVPVGKSGLWFPRRVVLEKREGEKLILHETVEVEQVKLNEPIDPTIFTFAALPEGTYVQMPDPKQSGFIRNGKIDTNRPTTHFQDTTPPEPTPVNPPAKGVNYWLIAACVAFALAGVAVLIFRRRSEHAA